MNLALGTVQFGLQYGVANSVGKVTQTDGSDILQVAKKIGIDTLDTAIAYGDSEANLGAANIEAFNVITKLPALPQDCISVADWVQVQVNSSLKRLNRTQIDSILLHQSGDVIGQHAVEYQGVLQSLKLQGLCNSIGVSIYAPEELNIIWNHSSGWRPDIIQAPFNILDQRLISSGWLKKLNAEGVRVHTRSVFLQGLLLMSSQNRPAWFNPWTPLLDRWLEWCHNQSITPLKVALNFVCNQSGIEKVVVGVDSAKQLEEISEELSEECPKPPNDLISEDINLINPSRWKLV
ncbi:MAG: aldo/keto reductase [Methylotenera sp.]|nr:aldo/keto reductase [Methylotenera sp.]